MNTPLEMASTLPESRFDIWFFRNIVYRSTVALRRQDVFRELQLLERSQWDATEQLQARQLSRLNDLLSTIRESSPEYARRLIGVSARLGRIEELQGVPTLSKQDLRNLSAELQHLSPPAFCISKTTGGSTGEPVTLLKTPSAMARELAATWRGYSWVGVYPGQRQARFWGVPLTFSGRLKAGLIDFVCHRRRFSAFDFDETCFDRYASRLGQFKPDYYYGYVSMLVRFARWIGGRTHAIDSVPKAVITTAEVLTPDDREVIAGAFNCRVANEYGCGELGTVAHECSAGSLHINEENLLVEILDGDRACKAGEKGELVVTELNNTALPLVRYRTGDFASFTDRPCSCGRALRVIDQLYGRAYDFIVTPSGRQFHAEFLVYMFEEAKSHNLGISQFQVRQIMDDMLDVLVVPAPSGFSEEHEARLATRMSSLLGGEMRIAFRRVEAIPREKSGKMRVIVGLGNAAAVSGNNLPVGR